MINWSSVSVIFGHCYYFVLKHYSNLSVQNCTKNFLRPLFLIEIIVNNTHDLVSSYKKTGINIYNVGSLNHYLIGDT
jgi:hypothetical protein